MVLICLLLFCFGHRIKVILPQLDKSPSCPFMQFNHMFNLFSLNLQTSSNPSRLLFSLLFSTLIGVKIITSPLLSLPLHLYLFSRPRFDVTWEFASHESLEGIDRYYSIGQVHQGPDSAGWVVSYSYMVDKTERSIIQELYNH